MRVFPYRRIIVRTRLSALEAQSRIAEVTDPPNLNWFKRGKKPFHGSVNNMEFKVFRTINYRNSFLPQISGRISPDPLGSTIQLTMHPHPASALFMAMWLGVVGMIFFVFLGAMLIDRTNPIEPAALVVPGFMLLLGGGMTSIAFHYEANRAAKFLQNLFEAESFEESGISSMWNTSRL